MHHVVTRRIRQAVCLTLLAAFIAPVSAAHADAATPKTVYVATTGNDSNDGASATTPKLTIAAGVAVANPGDTVLVAPGTYNGNVVLNKGGSAKGGYITIRSQTKYGAVINGNGNTKDEAAVELNNGYVTVQDFTITGVLGVREGVIVNASNINIVGNTSTTFVSSSPVAPAGRAVPVSTSGTARRRTCCSTATSSTTSVLPEARSSWCRACT